VTPFICAGAGVLLAVLRFDLMFDVQVVRHAASEIPEAALASIAAYYARVTTAARPMNRLVAAAMVGTLASIVISLARGDHPLWVEWVSLPLVVAAIAVAGARTVPNAVRLGTRRDPGDRQRELAKAVSRDHLFCASAIATVLAVQLIFGS
jgi:hypothetical protein